MTLVQSRAVSLSSSDLVKMEERKRPLAYDQDDSAPPLKRQATSANGTKAHVDQDMPWKDDLEVCLISFAGPSLNRLIISTFAPLNLLFHLVLY